MSTSTAAFFEVSDVRSLLHEMIADIGQNMLRLSESVESLVQDVMKTGNNVDLYSIGPTTHASMLQNAFQNSAIDVRTMTHSNPASSHQAEKLGKVAVIGMSGRFPGSETIETFWEELCKGTDFHEKVRNLFEKATFSRLF